MNGQLQENGCEVMDIKKVQNLVALLKEAMRCVVVKHRSANVGMPADMYRRNLQQSWDTYTNEAHFSNYAILLEPDIEDARVREKILQVVRSELAQYIHEDRIQSATYAIFGGIGNGFPLDDLLKQLLRVAIVRGELHAAQAFFECVEGTHVSYQMIGLLSGVRVEQEIQISQRIRLIPLPKSTSALPPYLSHMGFLSARDLIGRTLVAIDCSISPVFKNPNSIRTLQDMEGAFKRQVSCAEYPDFNLNEFCDAFSLACDASIQSAAVWDHMDNDEICNVRMGYGGGSYIASLLHRSHYIPASEAHIHEAMSLYRARRNIHPEVARKLKVPIGRWIKSKALSNRVDTFIDLGIALESLYLEDLPDRGELQLRLSLRAAWHLGRDVEERQSLVKELREIYKQRSHAVHSGAVKSSVATPEFTQRAQDLCRQSIVKVINHGQFPDWNRLVLGDDGNIF